MVVNISIGSIPPYLRTLTTKKVKFENIDTGMYASLSICMIGIAEPMAYVIALSLRTCQAQNWKKRRKRMRSLCFKTCARGTCGSKNFFIDFEKAKR